MFPVTVRVITADITSETDTTKQLYSFKNISQ